MNRSTNQEEFSDTLIRFNRKIESLGNINVLSNHIYSENFFRDLLNVVYGYSLQNQNKVEKNAQAFDLIDIKNKIIIQVSATITKQKIENTLKKDNILKKQKEGYRLMFLFIGKQNLNIKSKKYENPYNILFDSEKDIILTQDLCEKFFDLSISYQNQTLDLIRNELSPILFEESLIFLKEEFINEKLKFNISNLASRYFEENDVDTVNNKIVEAISISNEFKNNNNVYLKNIKKYIENDILYNIKSDTSLKYYSHFKNLISPFKQSIDSYLEITKDFEEKKEYLKRIYDFLEEMTNSNIFQISDYNIPKINHIEKNIILNYIRKIEREVIDYKIYLKNTCKECLFSPFLLVQGEAGIGKSHLLAHLSKKLRNEKHITYLFLGQFFIKDENPWNQILKDLEITCSIDSFLWAINSKAEETKKRAFIIIDALNEGEGKRLWENHFQSFINKLKKYPNIALIFSIRTPFEDIILPKEAIFENNITRFKHNGFSKETYEPIRAFCDFYELELPKFPILNSEFNNPLFLKLMCEYCENKSKKFDQTLSIADVFNNVLEKANVKLSKENSFDYDKNINVVQKVIKGLVELMNNLNCRHLTYEEAYRVVNNISKNYVQKSGKFLEVLIDENILSKNNDYNENMIVYFSYERMGDYFLAEYLLEGYCKFDIKDKEKLMDLLSTNEKLTRYFNTESDLSFNAGLMNELFIKLANEYSIELFELFPRFINNHHMIYSFVNSLLWRTDNSISTVTKNYINENILPYKIFREAFLDVLLTKISQKNHPLNVMALHKFLKECDLGVRDLLWTQYISINSEETFKVINWIFNNYNKLDEESAKMYMIFITWVFSTTNIKLRDYSTKSLVKLFREFPNMMIEILDLFKNNDDPYIVERLYASVFGGVLRSNKCGINIEIANYIYNEIFNKESVYPHILMRDYARQTIEYICLSNNISNINIEKIRPPYNSKWYEKTYSNSEIDNYANSIKNKLDSNLHIAIDKIIKSMTTEYGRGIAAYGDFGRYVFGYGVKRWEKHFNSDQELSNIAIMRVFEMGYNAELHGKFDIFINSHDRDNNSIERIGKKYQWIAFYEILAKLVDKFSDYLYSGLWMDYIRDIDPTLLLVQLENESKELLPSPMPLNPSLEWVKSNAVYDETNTFVEIEIDNRTYISLSSRFSYENREDKDSYSDRDSCLLVAKGYFYNKKESNEILQEYETNFNYGINIPSSSNIYLYEFCWSDSYRDHEKECMRITNEKKIIAANEYFWELDYSIKDKSISFYIPSKKIISFFSLNQQEEGIWANSNGEIVCLNTKLLGFDNECLLVEKDMLLEFLSANNLSIGWEIYLEKISHRERQEWWYNVFYDNGDYSKKIVHNENSNIGNIF
ncbi:SMEK domain-containing protein [Staphylococcus xylosus]|uniref:SMEK domain-containing protein n=1 Tax=Staphylococcus xylosus TaxID=1288 RepID=UPI002DBB8A9F|nr:SMEK domain-containing protein [Staphylococcus xylosus]MEB6320884.1 SMEK domain-containing protein [Staphylococcus xylosus]